jgi:hypothetical protein
MKATLTRSFAPSILALLEAREVIAIPAAPAAEVLMNPLREFLLAMISPS